MTNGEEIMQQLQLTTIEKELEKVRADLDFIKEHIVKATDTIDKVSVEVMPTIDMLMQHPMLKMLMPKGKK